MAQNQVKSFFGVNTIFICCHIKKPISWLLYTIDNENILKFKPTKVGWSRKNLSTHHVLGQLVARQIFDVLVFCVYDLC